jgi:hypothetical protein
MYSSKLCTDFVLSTEGVTVWPGGCRHSMQYSCHVQGDHKTRDPAYCTLCCVDTSKLFSEWRVRTTGSRAGNTLLLECTATESWSYTD